MRNVIGSSSSSFGPSAAIREESQLIMLACLVAELDATFRVARDDSLICMDCADSHLLAIGNRNARQSQLLRILEVSRCTALRPRRNCQCLSAFP